MQVINEVKPIDTINVTPMLDLAYVLLVVFILMTTASVQGLTITLPKPSNKPSAEKHELKIVQVMPDGGVLLNGVGVSLPELEQQLQQAKSLDAQMSVAIKGDARTQYASVVAVIDLCNKLQVNMGLVTAKIGT
ncbi:biopolymer transporter ExbD [Paucibacter sp. AS339]|jgi:biopolymer transport protein ExbD|uniref:ExbD/TolR family protein n=1 Tax=Roseateles TaxID=93681 RepID=UPI0021E4CAA6|nr:biopolymer transporter ExbD [Paucibacter sp. Y2R2-4]MCV2349663.1 biopolymer transporter ExbD [Paucibacter sp. Y2R2-4]